jgi:hypothetical protein
VAKGEQEITDRLLRSGKRVLFRRKNAIERTIEQRTSSQNLLATSALTGFLCRMDLFDGEQK